MNSQTPHKKGAGNPERFAAELRKRLNGLIVRVRKCLLMERYRMYELIDDLTAIGSDSDRYFDAVKSEIEKHNGARGWLAPGSAPDYRWEDLSPGLRFESKTLTYRLDVAASEFEKLLVPAAQLLKLVDLAKGAVDAMNLALKLQVADGAAPSKQVSHDDAKKEFSGRLSSILALFEFSETTGHPRWRPGLIVRSALLLGLAIAVFYLAYVFIENNQWGAFDEAPKDENRIVWLCGVAPVCQKPSQAAATATMPGAALDGKTEECRECRVEQPKDKAHGNDKLRRILKAAVALAALLTTIWAVQSYWKLATIDSLDKRWRVTARSGRWREPFTFHYLAQSHKRWAQLWFSWCVAIFLGGFTYAVCTVEPSEINPDMTWPNVAYDLFTKRLHHAFVLALFGFCCYWASQHYKSHWHNYVMNAYRHRALSRFEELRDDLLVKIKKHELRSSKAEDTLMELYRLSGVLLLEPIDSSYSTLLAHDDAHTKLSQMEDITKAFNGEPKGHG